MSVAILRCKVKLNFSAIVKPTLLNNTTEPPKAIVKVTPAKVINEQLNPSAKPFGIVTVQLAEIINGFPKCVLDSVVAVEIAIGITAKGDNALKSWSPVFVPVLVPLPLGAPTSVLV